MEHSEIEPNYVFMRVEPFGRKGLLEKEAGQSVPFTDSSEPLVKGIPEKPQSYHLLSIS